MTEGEMNSPSRNLNFQPYLTHRMAKPRSSKSLDRNAPPRAGIESVEVGFGLLQALAASGGPLMWRDPALESISIGSQATFAAEWNGAIATALRAAAKRLSSDLGYQGA
jgi:hypothetical protein